MAQELGQGVKLPSDLDRGAAQFNVSSLTRFGPDLEIGPDVVVSVDRTVLHASARLVDGRPALLVDPGFVGGLRGDSWAKSVATAAAKAGRKPSLREEGPSP